LLTSLVAGLDARGGVVDGAGFKALMQESGKELGIRGRDLFLPVRAALSGRAHGPELPRLFDALGSAEARQRLAAHAG
jgi:glutamyl/glutaminyl-tRNA synthetase